ncbi:unnamed protein product [Closterium sp. NIES-65]|nr:unnamed protein product [Closterium sp. NIES-65]
MRRPDLLTFEMLRPSSSALLRTPPPPSPQSCLFYLKARYLFDLRPDDPQNMQCYLFYCYLFDFRPDDPQDMGVALRVLALQPVPGELCATFEMSQKSLQPVPGESCATFETSQKALQPVPAAACAWLAINSFMHLHLPLHFPPSSLLTPPRLPARLTTVPHPAFVPLLAICSFVRSPPSPPAAAGASARLLAGSDCPIAPFPSLSPSHCPSISRLSANTPALLPPLPPLLVHRLVCSL